MTTLDLVTIDERLQSLLTDLTCAAQGFDSTRGFDGDEQIHNGLSDLISDVQGAVNAMQEKLREGGLDRELHAREQARYLAAE